MITTVHEDDLAAWYCIPEPIPNISIQDFALDDDDLFSEDLLLVQRNADELVELPMELFRKS